LGSQLLLFRGRGGAGKTVNLLRVAHHLYQEKRARVLILTYNKALVADIARLFAIMGIRDGLETQRISIQQIQSYVSDLLR
ncbi:TPA: RNA helicase, partial [Candidatus Acetothermia bacterium]|nr:RNA helicase [Candidatus Acetothermia bacterium]